MTYAIVRERITAALDQIGAGPEITRGMVEAQLHSAERQFLDGVKCTEFAKARVAWAREREDVLADRWPKWFKRREEGLFNEKKT